MQKHEENYQRLINKNKYQVFLFKSKVSLPFIFAIHPWFVLNKKGELSRWEVGCIDKDFAEKNWGHLYKNRAPLFQGLEIIPSFKKLFFWKSKLIGYVEGENALDIISFIEKSPENYPYLNIYKFRGPNSNTYVKWVIDNFPQCGFELPHNAFGKDFK